MAIRHDVVSHPFTIDFIRIKACQLCRRTDIPCSDRDDIQQEMKLYLWKKAHLFDPDRGNIEAFVTVAVRSWIGMELRRRARLKRHPESHAMPSERTPIENDGDMTTLAAVLRETDLHRRLGISPIDDIAAFELHEAIVHALRQLTDDERALLDHVVEHGVAGTARKHDVSRRQVTNALRRMRSRFEDAGLGAD